MEKDEYTNAELMVEVGDGYRLWVMDWGNREAKVPIIVLHGGPGAGTKQKHQASFDPERQRVIFFDQRGSGKSTPHGSRRENNTDKLARDITKIAGRLGIRRFYLFGYSWGSTLALYYAICYPKMVVGLVIGGVWSGSKAEIDAMHEAARVFYPDLWEKFVLSVPEKYRDTAVAYHLDKALNGNKSEQKKSAYALRNLEGGLMMLDDRIVPELYAEYDPAGTQIEISYMVNNCFMPENYLLENVSRIKVPVTIVQGRYDMVCPPDFAYRISKLIPNCRLYLTVSNHASTHENFSLVRAIFDGL